MATQEKGLLAVWTDVAPAAEADFNAWYDREHLAERAGIPGFLNARRYRAEHGAPKYFAAYDTERVDVLGSPQYAERITRHTPWTLRVFEGFTGTARMIASQAADHAIGFGGAMLTLRLAPGKAGARALGEALAREVVAPTAALPGIVRVTVAVGVVAALGGDPLAPATLAVSQPDAVALLVEGDDGEALARAADGPVAERALMAAGAARIEQSGRYRLLAMVLG